jgi:hypothetical protein
MSAPAVLAPGTEVTLCYLDTAVLNGAIGRVTGPLSDTGRLPVVLLSPPAACRAFPGGVKVRPSSVRPRQPQPAPAPARAPAAAAGTAGTFQLPSASAWAVGLEQWNRPSSSPGSWIATA